MRSADYLGIGYSDDLTIIQITVSDTRTVEQKKALYRLIARNRAAEPRLRPQDILMNLVEVKEENWSFSNGEGTICVRHAMSEQTQFRAEREGPVPISDMIAALGQLYIAMLSAVILMAAIVGVEGLTNVMDVLRIGDPAVMVSFTA